MKQSPKQSPSPPIAPSANPALKSGGLVAKHQVTEFSIVGPLPPPEVLRGYDQALPGLAERIVKRFELEGDHRRSCEMALIEMESLDHARLHREAIIGQVAGFIVAMSAIGAAVWLGLAGHQWASGLIAALGIGSIVAVFVRGRQHGKHHE